MHPSPKRTSTSRLHGPWCLIRLRRNQFGEWFLVAPPPTIGLTPIDDMMDRLDARSNAAPPRHGVPTQSDWIRRLTLERSNGIPGLSVPEVRPQAKRCLAHCHQPTGKDERGDDPDAHRVCRTFHQRRGNLNPELYARAAFLFRSVKRLPDNTLWPLPNRRID
jgi:hypothetical protein